MLAALRHWQQALAHHGPDWAAAFPQFADEQPLTVTEIDGLCHWLNEIDQPCDCERPGFFCSGVPGIIAHLQDGRLAKGAAVERCDLCQRYPTDDAARAKLVELGLC